MEFGRVPEDELSHIDFSLPPNPACTTQVLSKGTGNTKFYIGCSNRGRKDWIGKLYPKGTKEKDFLQYYAGQFNSIEFNGFYYQLHDAARVRSWVEKVPPGFLFCPKFTESITHIRRLKNARPEVDAYLQVITEFGAHLGPIFLMPHPQMGVKHLETIQQFIADVPSDIAMFLELRHVEWYKTGYHSELYSFMQQQRRGIVITDAAGRRDCVHMHLSTPQCFIRFVGNGLHPTDYLRIDAWVARIRQWMDQGLEDCYFFMHQHDELHSPQLIRYLIEQLNLHCGTSIKAPIIHDMDTLF